MTGKRMSACDHMLVFFYATIVVYGSYAQEHSQVRRVSLTPDFHTCAKLPPSRGREFGSFSLNVRGIHT